MGLDHSPNVVTDGLVFYIDAANTRCYSGSGLTANGLVGGIGGTLVNGVGFSSLNGGFFSFDGTNDYINFGTLTANTTGSATVSCWIKTTMTSQAMPLSVNAYGVIYINRFTTSGYILPFFDGTTGNNTSADISTISVNDGLWHMITGTNNGTVTSIYIDGQFDKSYNETYAVSTDIYNSIGGQISFNFFAGSISQAHIYNRALTAQEILQNYNATKGRYR